MNSNNTQFKIFGNRHRGGRNSQQDALYYGKYNGRLIMVVADGMGGHKGGEIASQIAINLTEQHFKEYKNSSIDDFFKELIPDINKSILEEGRKCNLNPHTTIVIAVIENGYLYYAHIGDSRLYLFNSSGLITRTRDDSVPEMLFQMDKISEEEMATHPDQNKLTKSLGGEVFEGCTIGKYKLNFKEQYAIVLCSDGLWEYFGTKEMHKILFKFGSDEEEIKKIVNGMIEKAHLVGGERGDNISLIVAKNKPIDENKVMTFNTKLNSSNKLIPILAITAIILSILAVGLWWYNKNEIKTCNIKAQSDHDINQTTTDNNATFNKKIEIDKKTKKNIVKSSNKINRKAEDFNKTMNNFFIKIPKELLNRYEECKDVGKKDFIYKYQCFKHMERSELWKKLIQGQ